MKKKKKKCLQNYHIIGFLCVCQLTKLREGGILGEGSITDHVYSVYVTAYTDKKGNQIFLIDKEIQKGSVAKSYMTNGLLV